MFDEKLATPRTPPAAAVGPSNALRAALARRNSNRPPVWFMRQAGRYHRHYQELRRAHDFVSLCKEPLLAAETALGPMRDFDFDAAILFSDLLFPLEALGMGLQYAPGPMLDRRLNTLADIDALRGGVERAALLGFQAAGVWALRARLGAEKGVIGFGGGPWTLFVYATDGSHQGELTSARRGLQDGRFMLFCEKLIGLLAASLCQQIEAGADTIAILDTAAGELTPEQFAVHNVPALRALIGAIRARCPTTPLIYYSRGTAAEHWKTLEALDIQCLGVDWRHDISEVLERFGERFAIQGNLDPQHLCMPRDALEVHLRGWFASVARLKASRRAGWICGLGHGVLPHTPEENVRLFLQLQREMFDGSG